MTPSRWSGRILLLAVLSIPSRLMADHVHPLALAIQADTTLKNTSIDILAVVVKNPPKEIFKGAGEFADGVVEIEEVLRGPKRKDPVLNLRFKPISATASIPEMSQPNVSIVKAEDLKEGDRIIISVEPGPPAVANATPIYLHNSVSRFQITQQMAKRSFLGQNRWWIGGGIVALLLVINARKKRPLV